MLPTETPILPVYVNPEQDLFLSVDAIEAFGPRGGLPVPGAMTIVLPIIRSALAFPIENRIKVDDCHAPYHIGAVGGFTSESGVVGNVTQLTREVVGEMDELSIHPMARFDIEYLEVYIELVRENTGAYPFVYNRHAENGTDETLPLPGLEDLKYAIEIKKGIDPRRESNSAIRDAIGESTGVLEYIEDHFADNIRRVFVVGLALNICVFHTIRDLVKAGFEVVVVLDGCSGIDVVPGHIDARVKELEEMDEVSFAYSYQLMLLPEAA